MLFVMNDVEKRRLQLLQETRKNYNDKYTPPAVHPRFQSTYDSLYRERKKGQKEDRSSFFVRALIAILLFALLFLMDYSNEKIGNIDSRFVIIEVQRNLLGK